MACLDVEKGKYFVDDIIIIEVLDGKQVLEFVDNDPYLTGGTGIPSKTWSQEVPDGTPCANLWEAKLGKAKTRKQAFKIVSLEPRSGGRKETAYLKIVE